MWFITLLVVSVFLFTHRRDGEPALKWVIALGCGSALAAVGHHVNCQDQDVATTGPVFNWVFSIVFMTWLYIIGLGSGLLVSELVDGVGSFFSAVGSWMARQRRQTGQPALVTTTVSQHFE